MGGPNLEEEVLSRLWPTPRTEGFDAGAHRGKPDSLHSAVKLLPTPMAQDARHGTENAQNRLDSGRQMQMAHVVGLTSTGGKLSAAWVTRMMNYPDGWLDVE